MAAIINTNIASLNAQRNLGASQSALQTSLQRLSSGLRINSAKDDAAGLAISERMTSQINGLNQASRNANDGISLAQTAEGALGEITNNLQRIRELAVQSANATNSASDRNSLQAEATQLIEEISRVATQTQFNGLNLLDGSFTTQDFQVGANAGQTISVSAISDARSSALGSHTLVADGSVTSGVLNTATTNGVTAMLATANFKITTDGGTSDAIAYAANSGADAIAAAINTAAGGVGVTAVAENSATLNSISHAGDIAFTLNGESVSATITSTSDLTNLVSAINGVQGATGVTAEFSTSGSKAGISLTTTDGRNISIDTYTNSGDSGATVSFSGATLTNGSATTDSGVKTGTVERTSSKGAMATSNASAEVFASGSMNSSFNSVSGLSLETSAGSQDALAVIDAALTTISNSRAGLGAVQNRFTSVITSLQTSSENISAARSRIQDADFAAETAAMPRAQILQQAGTAMVSQANSLPNSVLSLLQG